MNLTQQELEAHREFQDAVNYESEKLKNKLNEIGWSAEPPVEPSPPTDPNPPPSGPKKTVAVCVGHSRSGDKGAVSVVGVSEWDFNVPISSKIKEYLRQKYNVHIFDYYGGSGGYGSAMDWLAKEIESIAADVAVELHFNAASSTATGFEYLYWGESGKSKDLANKLAINHMLPNVARGDGGIKPLDHSDNGSGFLSKTHCPSSICEPFFGSNQQEWDMANSSTDLIASGISTGIRAFLG